MIVGRIVSSCVLRAPPRTVSRLFPSVLRTLAKTAEKGNEEKSKAKGSTTKKQLVKEVKRFNKLRDPSKPFVYRGFTLHQQVSRIPPPPPAPEPKPRGWALSVGKNGVGLRASRLIWKVYDEPCFWTITKYKPSIKGRKPKAWGILTWRGITSYYETRIPTTFKRDWYFLSESLEKKNIKLNPMTPGITPRGIPWVRGAKRVKYEILDQKRLEAQAIREGRIKASAAKPRPSTA